MNGYDAVYVRNKIHKLYAVLGWCETINNLAIDVHKQKNLLTCLLIVAEWMLGYLCTSLIVKPDSGQT